MVLVGEGGGEGGGGVLEGVLGESQTLRFYLADPGNDEQSWIRKLDSFSRPSEEVNKKSLFVDSLTSRWYFEESRYGCHSSSLLLPFSSPLSPPAFQCCNSKSKVERRRAKINQKSKEQIQRSNKLQEVKITKRSKTLKKSRSRKDNFQKKNSEHFSKQKTDT